MSFGIVPASYSILLWAPMLAVLGGLVLWLIALLAMQPRDAARPAELRAQFAQWAGSWRHELASGMVLAAAVMGIVAVLGA